MRLIYPLCNIYLLIETHIPFTPNDLYPQLIFLEFIRLKNMCIFYIKHYIDAQKVLREIKENIKNVLYLTEKCSVKLS